MGFNAAVHTDSLNFSCECGGRAKVKVLTYDTMIVELRLTCEVCGQTDKVKIRNCYGFEGPAVAENMPAPKA